VLERVETRGKPAWRKHRPPLAGESGKFGESWVLSMLDQ
jgi:hypothetical protein